MAIATHVKLPPGDDCVVLDAGSGTGHWLARMADAMTSPVVGLGLDISRDAARYAARLLPLLAFAVADLWAEWPVRDATVDVVVSIFAPKNFADTARVLRPGGLLALAYPGPEHLVELRDRFRLLRQHSATASRYADMAACLIGPPSIARIYSRAVLDAAATRAAILMGPNAHHVDPSIVGADFAPLTVTFDIHVIFATKPTGGGSLPRPPARTITQCSP